MTKTDNEVVNPLDEQRAAHVRCLQDFAAAYDAESDNGRAFRAAIAALTAPPLCARGVGERVAEAQYAAIKRVAAELEAALKYLALDKDAPRDSRIAAIRQLAALAATPAPANPHIGSSLDDFLREEGIAPAVGREADSKADSAQGDEYKAGWIQCARWASRDDLIADIGSPAYEADRAAALWPTPQPEGGRGEAVACPCCHAPCTVRHASGDGGHWREYAYSPATPTDAARVRDAALLALANEWVRRCSTPECNGIHRVAQRICADELRSMVNGKPFGAALAAVEGGKA